MKKILMGLIIGTFTFFVACVTYAATITNGFTFAVADDYLGASFVGTHYHSSTGGDFGNPAGLAEVGGFFGNEEVRGLSEYDLTGLMSGGPAFVTFDVYALDGLFGQGVADGSGPFDIDIYSYVGNNAENVSDWETATAGSVGTFNTAGLNVGDILSFDVSSLLDAAILASDPSFGIRLQQDFRNISGPAITFNDFRLTTTDDTTTVPEPATMLLLGTGLVGVAGAARRKKKNQA